MVIDMAKGKIEIVKIVYLDEHKMRGYTVRKEPDDTYTIIAWNKASLEPIRLVAVLDSLEEVAQWFKERGIEF